MQFRKLGVRTHAFTWLLAAVVWTAVFFFPFHWLGFWAFAFPPWLFVAVVFIPFKDIEPFELALALPPVIWATFYLAGLAYGIMSKRLNIVSAAIHGLIPLLAIGLSLALVFTLNDVNLRGAS